MDVLNIKQFLKSGQERLELESRYEYPDIQSKVPLYCRMIIRTRATGLEISGEASGALELVCDRCLSLMTLPLHISFNERYVFSHLVNCSDREPERMIDDFYEEVDQEGQLDLKDIIRQLVLLEFAPPQLCGRMDCDFGHYPPLNEEEPGLAEPTMTKNKERLLDGS